MRLRVVWGLRVTIATFSPTSALSSVDLPALGRPRIETNPERNAMSGSNLLGCRYILKTDTHPFDAAFGRVQHLKTQTAVFEDFACRGNAASQFADQSANCGRLFLILPHAAQ